MSDTKSKYQLVTGTSIINIDFIEYENAEMYWYSSSMGKQDIPKSVMTFKFEDSDSSRLYKYIRKINREGDIHLRNYWEVIGIKRVTGLSKVHGAWTYKAELYVKTIHKKEECIKIDELIRSIKIGQI